MVRVQNIPQAWASINGRSRHVVRGYDDDHPAPEHIDENLSDRNLYVNQGGDITAQEQAEKYQERINAAIEEHQETSGKRIRKDAIPAYELVMARSDLGSKEANFDNKAWFYDSVEWAKKRFGPENIVGGALHLDEPDKAGKVHPHIHLVMTPGVTNEKGRRLSMKRTFDLGDFRKLQTQYGAAMKRHGLKRGEIKASPDRHIEPREFRASRDRIEAGLIDNYRDLSRTERKDFKKGLAAVASENYLRGAIEKGQQNRKITERDTEIGQLRGEIERMKLDAVQKDNAVVELEAELQESKENLGNIIEAYERGNIRKQIENLRSVISPRGQGQDIGKNEEELDLDDWDDSEGSEEWNLER